MKNLFIIVFTALFISAFASGLPEKAKREYRPPMWDTLFHKNEISINVILPLSLLTGGEFENKSLALAYLRPLTKSNLLRISSRHGFETTLNRYDNLTDEPFISPTPFYLLPDSVITQTTKSYRYYSPDIRIGYEHRFGKRRVKAILGMDILFGAEIENTNFTYRYLKPEMITDNFGNPQYLISEIQRAPHSASMRNINLKEGIAPFTGIFIHLSKRFSLRAVTMIDVYWTQSVSFFSDSLSLHPPKNQFKLGLQSYVADISFTAHF